MKKKGQILAERFDDVANELLRNPETKISFEKESSIFFGLKCIWDNISPTLCRIFSYVVGGVVFPIPRERNATTNPAATKRNTMGKFLLLNIFLNALVIKRKITIIEQGHSLQLDINKGFARKLQERQK